MRSFPLTLILEMYKIVYVFPGTAQDLSRYLKNIQDFGCFSVDYKYYMAMHNAFLDKIGYEFGGKNLHNKNVV